MGVLVGLLALGLAVMVLVAHISSDGSDTARRNDVAVDQELGTMYVRQAEACQFSGDKHCVKRCAEEMYRLLHGASQRDGIDRETALDYWREVMSTGDLG